MTILVTGASGFIGGHVVTQLAKNLTYTIIATGRTSLSKFDLLPNVNYIKADLTVGWPPVTCDVCIHCAGLADDRSSSEQFESNNVEATARLLETQKDCRVFIYISSASVYDFADGLPKTEADTAMNKSISLYGSSKLKAEKLIKESKLPCIYILRPRAVYGPGDRVLLPRLLKLIRKNKIILPGPFESKTSMTNIHNLYEAIEKSFEQSKPGVHVYNIADDYEYTLKEVIAEISFMKAGHKNFLHIPIPVVRILMWVQKLIIGKSDITRQSLNYITQDSVLSIQRAKLELQYNGTHIFFDSKHQLNIWM